MTARSESRLLRIARLLPVLGPLGVVKLAVARAARLPRMTLRVRGFSAPFVLRPTGSDLGVLRQTFVGRDCDVDVPSPSWIVDAGAYAGYTAAFFAKKYPGARILALEPSAENAALLRENCRNYPSVTVVDGALWYEAGTLQLETSRRGAWATQVRAGDGNVRAWTVDELMREYGIPHIDLLKIDIEGAEREIFGRPVPWLDQVGVLVCELHGIECERAVLDAANRNGAWAVEQRGEKVVLRRRDAPPPQPA